MPTIDQLVTLLWPRFVTLLGMAAVDLVFGVVLAIVQKRFDWSRVADFITSDLLPIFAWAFVEVLTALPSSVVPANVLLVVAGVTYGAVFLKILASVAGHFSAIGLLSKPLEKVGVLPTGHART